MHITIEQNKVIVNLDETEFPKFEAMFANLQGDKNVQCEFRRFPDFGGMFDWSFAPMHLCRVIGEANLSDDPFATVSLYPFWKHGFAFGTDKKLALNLGIEDPHKKGVAADEFGMGFCCWAMEEIFGCEFWADASAMIKEGLVVPTGTKTPDFVCGFKDGSLGIFEAKGTTRTVSALTQALNTGKYQAFSLDAQSPIKYRVVVGAALGESRTKIIIMDPPSTRGADGQSSGTGSSVGEPVEPPAPSNLTAALVKRAAKQMRKPAVGAIHELPLREPAKVETIFRGPTRQFALAHDDYRDDKRHGWLDVK